MQPMEPEEFEDLIESGHSCDERCYYRHHDDHLNDTPTGIALESAGLRGSLGSAEQACREMWREAGKLAEQSARSTTGELALEQSRIYNQLLAEWEDARRAELLLWEAQQAAARAHRRYEQRRAAAARRSRPRVDVRSANRPTRVDVAPEAWLRVKQRAIKLGCPVAQLVGGLVIETELPERDRPPGATAKRFARLFISDDDWLDLRAHAEQLGLTVSRLIGLIVEDEARRLGWRPEEEG